MRMRIPSIAEGSGDILEVTRSAAGGPTSEKLGAQHKKPWADVRPPTERCLQDRPPSIPCAFGTQLVPSGATVR